MQAKIRCRIAAELDCTDAAAVQALLVVEPRTHDEKQLRRIGGVLRLQCLVERDIAVDVLLVPQAMDQHDRNGDALLGQYLVHGLVLPKSVVGRMLHEFHGKPYLLQTVLLPAMSPAEPADNHVS